jgi:hypothetical protein
MIVCPLAKRSCEKWGCVGALICCSVRIPRRALTGSLAGCKYRAVLTNVPPSCRKSSRG